MQADSVRRRRDQAGIIYTGTTGIAATGGACTASAWNKTASVNAATAAAGLDGNLTTRFTTGRTMAVGDFYQVDFTGPVYLTGITLNNSQTSGNDYAARYDVYASLDGASWSKIVTGAAGAPSATTISFGKTQTRYLKVQVNTANTSGAYFSIGELQANGCSLQ